MFLEISQNSQENTCARVYIWIKLHTEACNFITACNFIKKEILVQVFSCEFREISKNNFFTEHLWTTASASWWKARKRKRCWVINKSHKKKIKIAASIDLVNTVKLCCNYCKYWHWTWCKLNQYCIMIGL